MELRLEVVKLDKNTFISNKIHEIAHEGVRKNTHAPVSSSNPRRKVKNSVAVAIAESVWKKLHPNG